ncbi:hypothetical protein [Actinoplanes sp. NPDC049599]|uniref:hypothetical protein n=1 Tax=Actinoplanes sp. NPDC049599 TaxID=3363903 RepID=UPI0037AAB397
MKARILLASTAAALATALLAASPASAHSTDDWSNGPAPEYVENSRYAESTTGNVRQKTEISWTGYSVVVRAAVSDLGNDGYCGAVQIRYEIRSSSSWAGHWHYRTAVKDCSANGDAEVARYAYSRYDTRNVHSRVCHATSSGAIVECESIWH